MARQLYFFDDAWRQLIRPQNALELEQKLSPTILADLDEGSMEALLDRLPQVGAIKGRTAGRLRVVSIGYHAHIQGTDSRSPYPIDFFVRVGGYLSSINLVLRLPARLYAQNLFEGQRLGADFDLFEALLRMNERGVGLNDLKVIMQRMYRAGVPNTFHWSTAGGVQALGEDARARSLAELAEEAEGLRVIASTVLLRNREYQGGNIIELHSVVGVLCIGEPRVSEQARSEGISEYCSIPLLEFLDWVDKQCALDLEDLACNVPAGKVDHAVLKLLHRCREAGIL